MEKVRQETAGDYFKKRTKLYTKDGMEEGIRHRIGFEVDGLGFSQVAEMFLKSTMGKISNQLKRQMISN